jgi:hypothetical protein
MIRNASGFLLAVIIMSLSLHSSSLAQTTAQQQDSLRALTEEFQSLTRIFETLNAGDTVYTPFFPMWSVLDRGMKLRIFSAFRNHNVSFDQAEEIHIIATPDQQDIANIKIGKAGFGKMYSKFVLSQDLHQTILARKYEYRIEVPVGYGVE